MKKFIITTGLFIIFAGVFYIIALPIWSFIMPPFMAKNVRNCIGCYGHLFTRVNEIPNVKNPNILFLGSSHAYRGFDPRVFQEAGISTFNLGSSAQTPINTKVLLQQYLDKIKPKMVVYEVYAGTLSNNGIESSLDLLSNNYIDLNSLNMAIEIGKLQSYNTLLYGFFRQIFGLNKNFQEPTYQNDNHYIKGGFVESNFKKNPLNEEILDKWNLNTRQIKILKENIDFIKKRNIPVVLVQAPITQKLYDARTNNLEIDKELSLLGTYKNFYGTIPLNDTTDFYDNNHLNQQGVVKFNKKVIEYLHSLDLEK